MKKIKIIAIIIATIMLHGCGVPTFQNPTIEVVGTVPTVVATLETMPVTETMQPKQYEFGDLVYTLETWSDGTVHVCRHAVVEHAGDVVIVTMAIGETAEDIRAGLPMALKSWAEMDPSEYLEQIDADAIYSSEKAAQDAADELMSGR